MKSDLNNGITLAIESAVNGGSLAIVQGVRVIAAYDGGEKGVSRAEDLMPNLERLLGSSGLDKRDISKIAVSIGPGSFTGLRIGIATAIGLKRSLGIDYVGISLLNAMAELATDESVISAVPMGKADVCFQRFSSDLAVSEPVAVSEAEFRSLLDNDRFSKRVVPSSLTRMIADRENESFLDVGTNLATIIGMNAATKPSTKTLDPIYVQSPRFI